LGEGWMEIPELILVSFPLLLHSFPLHQLAGLWWMN
jgi:hypothetical protein